MQAPASISSCLEIYQTIFTFSFKSSGPSFLCLEHSETVKQNRFFLVIQCRRGERCRFSPWLGRSLGERHGNPLHYSYLENPMDRGVWRAIVKGVTESQRHERAHTPEMLKGNMGLEWAAAAHW